MSEMPVSPADEPKKSNQNLIIGIVAAVVLLCCCCVGAFATFWLWNNGDALVSAVISLA